MCDNKDSELISIEEKVLEIWNECATFDVDKVGLNDNFFNIGGNSLYAIKVIVRIKKEFGIDISNKAFFDNATIAKMSILIKNLKSISCTKKVIDENNGRDCFEL